MGNILPLDVISIFHTTSIIHSDKDIQTLWDVYVKYRRNMKQKMKWGSWNAVTATTYIA